MCIERVQENMEKGKEREGGEEKYLNIGKKGSRIHAVSLTNYTLRG